MRSYSTPGAVVCKSCGAVMRKGLFCSECGATRSNTIPGAWPLAIPRDQMVPKRCDKCAHYLASFGTFRGSVALYCRRCKTDTVVVDTGKDVRINRELGGPLTAFEAQVFTPDQIVRMMQDRWETFRTTKLRERGTIAVGLRFRVFVRDGFRCRYCGISVDEGAILHVDHVVPQSRGGDTTLENLVTACIDCNLGKSDSTLPGNFDPRHLTRAG